MFDNIKASDYYSFYDYSYEVVNYVENVLLDIVPAITGEHAAEYERCKAEVYRVEVEEREFWLNHEVPNFIQDLEGWDEPSGSEDHSPAAVSEYELLKWAQDYEPTDGDPDCTAVDGSNW